MRLSPRVPEKGHVQGIFQGPRLVESGSPPTSPRTPMHSPPPVTRASSPPLTAHMTAQCITKSRSMGLPVASPRAVPRGHSMVLPMGGPSMRGSLPAARVTPNNPLLPHRIVPPKCSPIQDSTRFSMPTLPSVSTLPRSPSPNGYRSPKMQYPLLVSPVQVSRQLKQQIPSQHPGSRDGVDNSPLLAAQMASPACRSSSRDSTHSTDLCAPPQSHRCLPPTCESPRDPCAQTQASPNPSQEGRLAVGSMVVVEDTKLCLTNEIGKGSFGKVWGAKLVGEGEERSAEVALKEVTCRSKQALTEATFEGSLLSAFSSACGRKTNPEAAERIPILFGMQTDILGPQKWRVRLAMSRVPGQPLWKHVEQLPVGRRCLANAIDLSKELIVQLFPTLEFISKRAYHRDVTPRNILIESRDGETPRFGLIDFGLAVDAAYWRLGVRTLPSLQKSTGIPAWQHSGVAGDGRYWPVSSWYMFGHGPDELERRPGLCIEYKMQLDLHSLGISTLQVFIEMLPAEYKQDDHKCGVPESGNLFLRLCILHSRWRRYWNDASKLWQRIFETFKNEGDFKALKAAYVQARVHEVIRRNLLSMRSALQELRDTAQAEQQAAASYPRLCSRLSALADALLTMIGTGQKVDHAAGWASVSEILNATRQQDGSHGGRIEAVETAKLQGDRSNSTPPTSPSTTALVASQQSLSSPETASPEESTSPASSASCHAQSHYLSDGVLHHESSPFQA